MLTILIFCFGVIIGSFLNVLGIRWNSGRTIGGRSFCVTCQKTLHWWELIPVVSFVSQGGRCRGCKGLISWQYPLVELLTGIVFATIYNVQFSIYKEFTIIFIVSCLLLISTFCIYIVIGIYDLRHKIIPDNLVFSAMFMALIYRLIQGGSSLDWFTGPIIFIFFASIWFFSKGRAMGFGDAKLGLSVGILLGAKIGLSALVLAFWVGTPIALLWMLFSRMNALSKKWKRLTMKSEIPFAPFIIIGAWLGFILQFDLLHVALF